MAKYGMPSHSHAPLVIEGGFGVRENAYAPQSAFRNFGSLGELAGYGYSDTPDDGEAGASGQMSSDQMIAIIGAGEAVIGMTGDAIRRRKESMKGLIKKRISLKKKISRTNNSWKKKQYQRELEAVNMQIEQLQLYMQEDPYDEGGGLPWALIIGGVAIAGLVFVGVKRANRNKP